METIFDYNIKAESNIKLKLAIKQNRLEDAHYELFDQIIKKLGLLNLKPHNLKIRKQIILDFQKIQLLKPNLTYLNLPKKKGSLSNKLPSIGSYFKNIFSEKNWEIQYHGKFGGPKPKKVSWKNYYQENQCQLESQKKIENIFIWATEKGHAKFLQNLIEKNPVTLKKEGPNLLLIALKKHYNVIARLFIEHKVDFEIRDKNKWTTLHWSIYLNNQEMTTYLLNLNAKVNKKTSNGLTLLHLATLNGNNDLIDTLIKKGCYVNSKESLLNLNSLQLAFFKKQFVSFEMLLNNKINIHICDSLKRNLLHWSGILNYPNIAKQLLEKKINPNEKDLCGRTPAHWAAQNGHLEVLNHLINHNCDLTIKDKFNQNIKETASLFAQNEIYKRLTETSSQFL